MSAHIKALDPEKMSREDGLAWVKNCFTKAAHFCDEAREYWEEMHTHHQNIRELLGDLQELDDDPKNRDKQISILEVVAEISEAISDLAKGQHSLTKDSMSIDNFDNELKKSDKNYEKAAKKVDERYRIFFENYNNLKAKLGYTTQEEVAKLTGIDRRMISRIEKGETKPQFKTIVKIANAFGVEVSDIFPQI